MSARVEWTFRLEGQDGRLVLAADASPEERASAMAAAEARRGVRAWIEGADLLPGPSYERLQEIAEACRLAEGASPSTPSREAMRERIVSAAAEGRLLVFLKSRPKIEPKRQRAAPVEAQAPRAPAPKPKTEKTWIEIALVDDAGDPVAGEAYEIVLPDGSKRSGKLDAKGTARVEGIDPGTCKVLFPGFDGREWFRA